MAFDGRGLTSNFKQGSIDVACNRFFRRSAAAAGVVIVLSPIDMQGLGRTSGCWQGLITWNEWNFV